MPTGPGRRIKPFRAGLFLTLVAWTLAPLASGLDDVEPRSRQAPGDSARAPGPRLADFKLVIQFHTAANEPISRDELVVHDGLTYYFSTESPAEVVVLDFQGGNLELLRVDKSVQTRLTLARLDQKLGIIRRALEIAIRKRDATGLRADRVAADLTRALLDPDLAETFDPANHVLHLTSPIVDVEARGEPEPDDAKLALIDAGLTALTKLAAVRNVRAIPPFIRLDALHYLIQHHDLRPTELSVVYRLAGPPRKHRWTFELVDHLTPRELEALRRVNRYREEYLPITFEEWLKPPSD